MHTHFTRQLAKQSRHERMHRMTAADHACNARLTAILAQLKAL